MVFWRAETLLDVLTECGQIALDFYHNPGVEVKRDNSVVTRADKTIEARLGQFFDRPAEGCYLIGEETIETRGEDYIQSALSGHAYIVDPIDGTAPYTAGVPLWGISIGHMENGRLTDGCIYIPWEDTATFSLKGALWEARNLRSGNPEVHPFIPARPPLSVAGHIGAGQYCAKHWKITFPNQLFIWSACVISYHCLLRGGLMGYLQHCKLWDAAGAIRLLELAGYVMRTRSGENITSEIAAQKFFDLNPGPNRWKVRDFAVIANSDEIVDYIWSHCQENFA